jgi:hypothetical protein
MVMRLSTRSFGGRKQQKRREIPMSGNQRKHTTEAKLVPVETISDQIRPDAAESAVKQNDPATGQAPSVRNEHSSGKTAPRLKVVKDGDTTNFSFDHPNQSVAIDLLKEALGTEDADFAKELVQQLADTDLRRDEAKINFLLAVIKGIKPKDQLGAMLAAQMAVTHRLCMTFANRLNQVQTLPQFDSTERAYNKLARTFTTQMEALKRYQTGGDQKVTVQQVSVSEGGQAIVGNVTQSVREPAPDKAATSPPALADARMAPMPMVGNQEPMPVELVRGQKDESSA